jgi:predicted dehydrogenase
MSIQGSKDGSSVPHRRLRLGMVGGGQGAFIGAVHRIAARLDDRYELVAGALSADPERARASAGEIGIASERTYTDFTEMARVEAARDDGIDVVAIVTPNHLHYAVACAFLDAGIHVICDKPLTTSLRDALDLVKRVRASGLVFGLTHNYTGYPLVRQARAMVAAGELGKIRVIQIEYSQDWLTERLETTGHKQAEWRNDPQRSGPAGCLGDIGTHAYNLAVYISGMEASELCAELTTFVAGRPLDDNAQILLRYANGARGMLWASQVAVGNENALKIHLYGNKAGLEWHQQNPNEMRFMPFGEAARIMTRGGPGLGAAAIRAARIPPGHPEGYLEGFSNLYADIAEVIQARIEGHEPDPMALDFPTVEDGARGVKFIEAAVTSSRQGGTWVGLGLDLA